MFCWSCGHENRDDQKFCGECGRSLFKPEKVVREFTPRKSAKYTAHEIETAPTETAINPPIVAQPPQPPAGTMLTTPVAPSNPLIEEPRVVHEDPIAEAKAAPPPPTRIHDRVPNRITGPSFLGLSDAPDTSSEEDSSYLLYDEPESRSHAGAYVFIALLIVVSLLLIRNWQDVRAMAVNYSQKLGASDSPKPAPGPQRVTASNDASQMTPDAAPESGKSTEPKSTDQKPADQSNPATAKSQPQQTAKLDKPQADESAADRSEAKPAEKPSNDSADTEPPAAKAPATKAAPAPDNSQLEEAQKYLQGRGVPQDCNRGLDLLRSAAKQPNAKARIQMAALYESGHCVTADPVLAYSWFNRAQEVEPHNKLVERNLNSLWSKMTDEERREVTR